MSDNAFDIWEPMVEDDEAIRAALEDANIPALMVSLVHLTGDMDIVRGEIRPRARNLADPAGRCERGAAGGCSGDCF